MRPRGPLDPARREWRGLVVDVGCAGFWREAASFALLRLVYFDAGLVFLDGQSRSFIGFFKISYSISISCSIVLIRFESM